MRELGFPETQVLQQLNLKLERDLNFESGRILGSMCTLPHPIANKVILKYLEKNIGDPGLCPATVEIEQDAINMLGDLFDLRPAYGSIVTGGTEANILAFWTAKEMAPLSITKPEFIVPESMHFSFVKAEKMLNLKLVRIPLNHKYKMDEKVIEKAITENTIGIAAVAGSTALGMVDPLEEIAQIAYKYKLYYHIDAAFGGYVMPFLGNTKKKLPQLSFSYPGISSLTIDPHKMGMAPIPAGGIIYTSKELSQKVKVAVHYLSGGKAAHATIVGTRSGASVLAVWALLKHLGKRGYREIVSKTMELTDYFVKQISKLDDYEILIEPDLNVVGFVSRKYPVNELANIIRSKGWAVSLFKTHIRIVFMPHVKKEHIDMFLADLKGI
ncbi:MAG: tyrosine decarboxylase MfnA [Spirochaetales bacterium]|nr:tyrosine decarboxylase MfnA [Spirochaetales bacterium]